MSYILLIKEVKIPALALVIYQRHCGISEMYCLVILKKILGESKLYLIMLSSI